MKSRVIIPFIFLLSGCSTTTQIDQTVVSKLSGAWDEEPGMSCSTNFHTIDIKESNIYIEYVEKGYISENDARKILTYKILSQSNDSIRVLLENETRLDNDNKQVIWHLKSINNDEYCWSRDDWGEGSCTPSRFRCKT